MSTQSGISSSQDLVNTFKNFKSGALVIKVSPDNTQLIVDDQFKSQATDLSSVFSELNQYVSGIYPSPVYIILGLSSSSSSGSNYAFVSFIPDVAPIREKMLYASTKSTLISQLGSNNFSKSQTFAWTEIEELNYDNFVSSSESQDEGPLTHEEKTLKEINSLQGLTLAETGARRNNDTAFKKKLASMHESSSSGGVLMFNIDSNLESEFKSLPQNNDNRRLINFDIDMKKEEVKLISTTTNVDLKSLVTSLEAATDSSSVHPHFGLYNYSTSKFAFIYSCPSGSKVKDRMVYASNKQGLINHLKSISAAHNLVIDKVLEVGDLDELEVKELEETDKGEDKSEPSTRNGLKFTKPKGPRRR